MNARSIPPEDLDSQRHVLGDFIHDGVIITISLDVEADFRHPATVGDIVTALTSVAATFAVMHLPKEHGGGGL